MNTKEPPTSYSLFKTYRTYAGQVEKLLLPEIRRSVVRATFRYENCHSVLSNQLDGYQFCCSVYESSLYKHRLTYMIVPRTEYFDAIALDHKSRKYFLYDNHFFKRYAERLNLGKRSNTKILKHFLKHNPLIVYNREVKKRGNMHFFMAVVRTGVVYGYTDVVHNIVRFRTLIDHFTLTKKKVQQTKKLRGILSGLEAS